MQSGVYRHYKGKLYYVMGVARNTETNEELIIYVPLYQHEDGGIPLQARPRSMFNDSVETAPGIFTKRFFYLGESIPKK